MVNFHIKNQGRWLYFFKLFAIFLPIFCLLSWASSTTSPTLPSLPPSVLAASRSLKTSGYSIFAALIASTAATDTESWNGTGTILAPPDFAFSFAATRFNNRRPARPSPSLLLHHILQETLTWHNFAARGNGNELRTWHPNTCVFVSKGLNGNLGISPRKHSSQTVAVKIRRPDLFVDGHLTVHGVDDVLDPTSASTCSFPVPPARVESQIDRSFLDHAVRALRKRGFGVVATAIAIKQSDLINQTEITVLAPSDASIFSNSGRFHFDFLQHVLPKRRHYADFASISAGTAIETLSPNKSVVIESESGDVTVNGVAIQSIEVYQNRWIVVLSVSRSVNDAGDSESEVQIPNGVSNSVLSGTQAFTPQIPNDVSNSVLSVYPRDSSGESPFPAEFLEYKDGGAHSLEQNQSHYVPVKFESQAFRSSPECKEGDKDDISLQSPSPAEEGEAIDDWMFSPVVSPATWDAVISTLSLPAQDEVCPATLQTLLESAVGTSVYLKSTAYDQSSEKLVQSGPSRGFNAASEMVVMSGLSAKNQTELGSC